MYDYISDVWIFNDNTTRHDLQKNVSREYENKITPGYGLSLIAESTTGIMLSTYAMCDSNLTAEEFGTHVARMLLQEISYVFSKKNNSNNNTYIFFFFVICILFFLLCFCVNKHYIVRNIQNIAQNIAQYQYKKTTKK